MNIYTNKIKISNGRIYKIGKLIEIVEDAWKPDDYAFDEVTDKTTAKDVLRELCKFFGVKGIMNLAKENDYWCAVYEVKKRAHSLQSKVDKMFRKWRS